MVDKKIVGFKKFSDIKSSKVTEVDGSIEETPEVSLPNNPNLPKASTKVEEPASIEEVVPSIEEVEATDERVKTYGKVAKFPKNVKASKAFNFLESVKISKKSIWYIMVEKQDNELQMVKYNYKEGVDLSKFVNEVKTYYMKKYASDKKVCSLIESIYVDGNDKYSMVKNIPLVEVDGKKLITKLTEDLIKLLSK